MSQPLLGGRSPYGANEHVLMRLVRLGCEDIVEPFLEHVVVPRRRESRGRRPTARNSTRLDEICSRIEWANRDEKVSGCPVFGRWNHLSLQVVPRFKYIPGGPLNYSQYKCPVLYLEVEPASQSPQRHPETPSRIP